MQAHLQWKVCLNRISMFLAMIFRCIKTRTFLGYVRLTAISLLILWILTYVIYGVVNFISATEQGDNEFILPFVPRATNCPVGQRSMLEKHSRDTDFSVNSSFSAFAGGECESYCNRYVNATAGEGYFDAQYELITVHVVSRHGDRTPIFATGDISSPTISCDHSTAEPKVRQFYKLLIKNKSKLDRKVINVLDVFKNNSQCVNSQLTHIGVEQHLEIGTLFRKVYVDRLGLFSKSMKASASSVYARSTSFSRTYESALAQLYGLFAGNATFLDNFQIECTSQGLETCSMDVIDVPCLCPRIFHFDTLADKQVHQTEYNRTEYIEIKKQIAWVLGVSPYRAPWVGQIMDVLMGYRCHNLLFPCSKQTKRCFSQSLHRNITNYIQYYMKKASHNSIYVYACILRSTPIILEIANRIKHTLDGKSTYKFHLYSGHDLNVEPLIVALGLTVDQIPPYASRVVFELYKNSETNMFYIRILYNGIDITRQSTFCPKEVGSLCPLDRFFAFADHVKGLYLRDCPFK